MEKITVELCMGTTCFVMGGSGLEEFVTLLTPQEQELVMVQPSTCIGLCKDRAYGRAPYARVNGEVVAEATISGIAAVVRKHLG